jgi:hypothetical protein
VFYRTGVTKQGSKWETMGRISKKDLGVFGSNIPGLSLL